MVMEETMEDADALLNELTIAQLKNDENSFIVLTTDIISTFGLSFSQIPVRLCHVAVPGVLGDQRFRVPFCLQTPLSTFKIMFKKRPKKQQSQTENGRL